MSTAALRASRALWAKRLDYRRKREDHWQAKHQKAKAAKWHKLAVEAKQQVDHRDRQLASPKGVSDNCVALVARFEGFVDHVYRDAVGVETIGYGETRRDIINKYRGGRIPEADARALLRERLTKDYAPPVLALRLPTQNAIDATVSLVYNTGAGSIAKGTTIGNALRRKDWPAAANGFLLWDRAGGQRLPGLTRRRQEERALFLKSLPI